MQRPIISCISLILSIFAAAQEYYPDSLLEVLRHHSHDRDCVNTLNALSISLNAIDPDSAIHCAGAALQLAEELNYSEGKAEALCNYGSGFWVTGNYPAALEKLLRANTVFGDNDWNTARRKWIRARILGNLGNVYADLGEHQKALTYFHESNKYLAQLSDRRVMAHSWASIGDEQSAIGDNEEALSSYRKAMAIYLQNGDSSGVAMIYCNIGVQVWTEWEDPALTKEEKDRKLSEARIYFENALAMNERMGDSIGITVNLTNLGAIYRIQGDRNRSEETLLRALAMAEEAGSYEDLKMGHEELFKLYSEEGKYAQALLHYKAHIAAADSISNESNIRRQTQLEMNYEFSKKQAADSIRNAEQQKQETLKHDNEIKQQRLYTYGGIAGFVLMMIVAFVSFRAYRNKQKANMIIAHQKNLVEEKQKEIIDSINYARRIQRSLLPSEKYISKKLKEV